MFIIILNEKNVEDEGVKWDIICGVALLPDDGVLVECIGIWYYVL